MRISLGLFVLLFGSSSCFAEEVAIELRVYSRAKPEIGVPATIFRKKSAAAIEEIGNTDENGLLVVYDTDCKLTTSYRAVSTQPAIFPDGPPEWKPCVAGKPIEISMLSTGLSEITEAFLRNIPPSNVQIPKQYAESVEAMLVAQKVGQWGISAKLGSQLAYQFSAAGYDDQALIFGELSLASAAIFAVKETNSGVFVDTLLDTAIANKHPKLSTGSLSAIKSFQSQCGVEADGKVGWATMSCLPGGKGYLLPPETLTSISSGSTGGGF
jgi:hypothetical protein